MEYFTLLTQNKNYSIHIWKYISMKIMPIKVRKINDEWEFEYLSYNYP